MLRPVQLLALLLMLPVLGLGAAGATAATVPATPLSATVESCKVGKDVSSGRAVFVGSMPQIDGATRMEMRFELLQAQGAVDADPTAGFVTLPIPKWSAWVTSQPGRSGFVYRKRIVGLVGPSSYRAQVVFRWRDGAGKVVRTARRKTPVCVQPDLRPNLAPVSVTARPVGTAAQDVAEYRVLVRNLGRSAAGAFSVAVDGGGGAPASDYSPGLPGKGRTTVVVVGGRCQPGATLYVTVDRQDAVDEADESDNVLTVPCPLT